MASIPLFRYDPPVPSRPRSSQDATAEVPPAPGTVSLTPAGAAGVIGVIVALSGAFQPWLSTWVSTGLQKRQEEARLRTETIAREAAWLKSALAVEDAGKRNVALKFLVKARLVEDPAGALDKLTAAEIPYLAPIQPPATPEIKNTNPPVPGRTGRTGGDALGTNNAR